MDKKDMAALRALASNPTHGSCTLGVGCDEVSICYAAAHNSPENCGRRYTIPVEAAAALALLDEVARLREALQRWQHYGCPDCGGDCGAANPPVLCCIMQETRAALEPRA